MEEGLESLVVEGEEDFLDLWLEGELQVRGEL